MWFAVPTVCRATPLRRRPRRGSLAHDLGREDQIEGVRVPRHEPGPPETLTDTDYANLVRVPDRRTLAGKRDYALLRVLGDCGLRSAELRGLRARDLRRPRSNARHHRLFGLPVVMEQERTLSAVTESAQLPALSCRKLVGQRELNGKLPSAVPVATAWAPLRDGSPPCCDLQG